MVSTLAPSSEAASTRQPRTILPSTRTVQAPHTPCSQPVCEPIRPRSRRRKSIRCRRASTRRATRSPLTVSEMSTCGAHAARASSRAGEAVAARAPAARGRGGASCRGCRAGRRADRDRHRARPAPRRWSRASTGLPASGRHGPFGHHGRVADAEEDEPRIDERAAGDLRPAPRCRPWRSRRSGAPARGWRCARPAWRRETRSAAISSCWRERRGVEAGEELRRRDAPLVRGAARDDDGIERDAAGRQLGGRIGEGQRAADGAAVADGGMGDQRHGLGEQRHMPAHQLVGAKLGMGGERADADRVAGLRRCRAAPARARCRSACWARTGGRRAWRAGSARRPAIWPPGPRRARD